MLIGIFSDTHDHLDNIRRAVAFFNERECKYVLFAGDLVSTFAIPPLRQLKCPLIGCYGDNEGNRIGIQGGMRIIGQISDAPVQTVLDDGTRVVIAHMPRQLRAVTEPFDVAIHGHTHKPSIRTDDAGRLIINPGETSGWTYGNPTVALLETSSRQAEIIPLLTPTSD